MSTGLHRACRWGLAFLLTLAVGIAVHAWLVPRLVARYLRHELAARGFSDAELRVASVGLDHVRLAGVSLAPGLDLGDVELDAGWSLLWRDARTLTLRGAHLTRDAIERWGAGATPAAGSATSPHAALQRLPIQELRLADCTLDLGPTQFAISGALDVGTASPQVSVTASAPAWQLGPLTLREVAIRARTSGADVRVCVEAVIDGVADVEGCAPAASANPLATRALDVAWTAVSRGGLEWTASGRGHVTWTQDGVSVTDAKFEVAAPELTLGSARLDDVRARGVVTGPVAASSAGVRIGDTQLDVTASSAQGRELRIEDVRAKVVATSARAASLSSLRVDRPHVELEAAAGAIGKLRLAGVQANVTSTGATIDSSSTIRIDRPALDARAAAIRGHEVQIDGVRLTSTGSNALTASADGMRAGRSRVELTAKAAAIYKLVLGGVRLVGIVDGREQLNALALAGTARARRAAVRGRHATRLTDVSLPFAFRAWGIGDRARVVVDKPMVARAADAMLEVGDAPMRVIAPVMSLRPKGALAPARLVAPPPTIPWTARSFAWKGLTFAAPAGTISLLTPSDVQHIGWKRVTGRGPIDLGKGWIALRELDGAPQIVAGEVRAFGGTIGVAARQPTPREVVLDVRGLALAKLLAAARTHVEATGLVDGVLVLGADAAGCSLRRLSLWARGPGVLRVRDPKLRAAWARAGQKEISSRVHGALADFAYGSLTFMVQPPGSQPEVQLATRGSGRLIKQSLDLVINLHGARAAVEKLARRASW